MLLSFPLVRVIAARRLRVCVRADQDMIVQHLVVDGLLLAVFIFHLERTAAGRAPTAELIGFQKRRATPAGRPPSLSFPSPTMVPPLPPPAAVSSPGYMAAGSGYGFPSLPPLAGLPPPPAAGDIVGPSGRSSSGGGGGGGGGGRLAPLDHGAGLLGTNSSSPGRMYYPQS